MHNTSANIWYLTARQKIWLVVAGLHFVFRNIDS